MSILVLADTHLESNRVGTLIDLLGARLDAADAIIHAGDITAPEVVERLADHAPVHAVAGNNDIGSLLPETVVVEVGGVSIAVIHDSGAAQGRATRLSRAFPDADVVVFGHSHLPWNETIVIDGKPRIHFNPGSPTQRRRAPNRTVGWIDVDEGGTITCRHEIVDP